MANILLDLSKPSYEDLVKMVQAQASKLEELAKAKSGKLVFKASPNKGAVMVCGMGRIPATLYASQWLRILDVADDLRSWIEANRKSLAWKE